MSARKMYKMGNDWVTAQDIADIYGVHVQTARERLSEYPELSVEEAMTKPLKARNVWRFTNVDTGEVHEGSCDELAKVFNVARSTISATARLAMESDSLYRGVWQISEAPGTVKKRNVSGAWELQFKEEWDRVTGKLNKHIVKMGA